MRAAPTAASRAGSAASVPATSRKSKPIEDRIIASASGWVIQVRKRSAQSSSERRIAGWIAIASPRQRGKPIASSPAVTRSASSAKYSVVLRRAGTRRRARARGLDRSAIARSCRAALPRASHAYGARRLAELVDRERTSSAPSAASPITEITREASIGSAPASTSPATTSGKPRAAKTTSCVERARRDRAPDRERASVGRGPSDRCR